MGDVIYPNHWKEQLQPDVVNTNKSLVLYKQGALSVLRFDAQYIPKSISSGRVVYEILEPEKKIFEVLLGETLDFDIYSIALEDLIGDIRLYVSGLTSSSYCNQPETIKIAFEKQNEELFRRRCQSILKKEFMKND